MSFPARYPGVCAQCDEKIVRDQEVAFTAADDLVHVVCPDPIKPRPVCPRCFLELPATGVCDQCDV